MKTTTIGERLKDARTAAGLSTVETAYRLRDVLLPGQWVSYATIHRLERAADEAKVDPVLVDALAEVYGVPTASLSPQAAEWIASRFRASGRQKRRSPCTTELAGQRSA